MMSEFWREKKVLVTGHTGFKGSWLALWLQTLGANVYGLSLPADELSLYNIIDINNKVESLIADITSLDEIKNKIITINPDVVFHLAAQSLVRDSYRNPVETYNTNVMGTINLLETLRECSSVRAAVIVTSDKCYKNFEWEWAYRENDILGGKDPYSSSKSCAELITESYYNSFLNCKSVNVATARAGNVVGGGDWGRDRLIPDIVRAYEGNSTLSIRYPDAVRPWQHVCEPLYGYLILAEKLFGKDGASFSGAWNFGPVEESIKTVRWVVENVHKLLPNKNDWKISKQGNPHESSILKLDSSKARMGLGWRTKLSIENAIGWTVDWYVHWLNRSDMLQFTIDQILEYQDIEAL